LDGESGVLGRNNIVREEHVRELGGGAGIDRQGEEGGSLSAQTARRCCGSSHRRKREDPKTHFMHPLPLPLVYVESPLSDVPKLAGR